MKKIRWPVRAARASESTSLRYHGGQQRDFKMPTAEYVLRRGSNPLQNPRPRCTRGLSTTQAEKGEERGGIGDKPRAAHLPEDLRGGQRNKILPAHDRVADIQRRRMPTRGPAEGRISTGTKARTREMVRGEEPWGGQGTFSQGATIGRLAPPSAPTSDEPPGVMPPFQSNGLPLSVTPVPLSSLLMPQSPGEGIATASTATPEGALPPASRPPEASPPATLVSTTETVAQDHTPPAGGSGRRSHHRRQNRCSRYRHHSNYRFRKGCHTFNLREGHNRYLLVRHRPPSHLHRHRRSHPPH